LTIEYCILKIKVSVANFAVCPDDSTSSKATDHRGSRVGAGRIFIDDNRQKKWSTGFGPKRVQPGGLTKYSALFSRHLPGVDFPRTSTGAGRIPDLAFGQPVKELEKTADNSGDH